MGIDFQRLLDVCKATEALPLGRFDMSQVNDSVNHGCGTAGCMIGQYNAMIGREPFRFSINDDESGDWEHFGITEAEYHWLFYVDASYSKSEDVEVVFELATNWNAIHGSLQMVSRREALRRLRKFIYYKMHKAEMTIEEARHKEGNHGFAMRAKQQAEELATA